MKLDHALVHLSPLVNSYKGRDYFSAFVFYSANLKDGSEGEATRKFCVSLRSLREAKG